MTEIYQSVLNLDQDLETPLPEEDHEIWSQQPDNGPTHVKNPKDLVVGNTYFLHVKGKEGESDEVEKFVLRQVILLSEVLPDTRLSMMIASTGRTILASRKLYTVGLMPGLTASYHRGGAMGHHHFRWSENWVEDPELRKE